MRVWFLSVAASMAVVACSSTSNVAPTSPAAACTSVAPPMLGYPSAGATGINSGFLQLWFFYPRDPSTAFDAPVLSASGGATLTGTPYASPSPGPTPPGLPATPRGDEVFVSSFTGVASTTTYTVTVTNPECGADTLGSFTTR